MRFLVNFTVRDQEVYISSCLIVAITLNAKTNICDLVLPFIML